MPDNADKPKPPQTWGKGSHQFYEEHRGQTVLVGMVTDVVFKGELVGLDTYDIVLRLDSGTEVLIHKGNIVYVHQAK